MQRSKKQSGRQKSATPNQRDVIDYWSPTRGSMVGQSPSSFWIVTHMEWIQRVSDEMCSSCGAPIVAFDLEEPDKTYCEKCVF